MKAKLTARTVTGSLKALGIKRAELETKGQVDIFDASTPGFALRVFKSDRRKFMCFYRLNRRLHRKALGDVDAVSLSNARKEANRARSEIQHGRDPFPFA